jgi:hypothetical protein
MIAARPQGGAGERRPVPAAPLPQGGLDAITTRSGTVARQLAVPPYTVEGASRGGTAITAPVDRTHAECVEALRQIRARFADAHQRVANWHPAPYPTHPT